MAGFRSRMRPRWSSTRMPASMVSTSMARASGATSSNPIRNRAQAMASANATKAGTVQSSPGMGLRGPI